MDLLSRLEALHPGASRRSVKQWLAGGRVQVNGTVVRRGDVPVGTDDRVTLGPPPPPTLPGRLRIVHDDPRFVVVDKPAGLLTIATERERLRTAYRLLRDHFAARGRPGDRRQPLFIVHRLDRETSGLLVFARTPATKQSLQAQFASRTVERRYVAVVEGRVRDDAGTLRMRLVEDAGLRVRVARGAEGRDAVTHYRVVARGADATRVELQLETGRRGQIRAQLAASGHPIVGDAAYGSRQDPLRRVCLHATRLGFVDERGQDVAFDSPPPGTFLDLTGR